MTETLFTDVRYDLGSLISFIELGEIGLPDLQRPFVWPNAKIRDLFDSMYRGYPVGYLLFWLNAGAEGSRAIGTDKKQKVPRLLVVDGQQRLTALYAVVKGIEVIRANYQKEKISIAFNPIDQKFDVADAAIKRDPAYIPDISTLWNSSLDFFDIVEAYLEKLSESREIETTEKRRIRNNIQKVHALTSFPFTALELSPSLDDEQVSEVFVRINSKGKPLKQADFILTLMSVFWDAGRHDLENFCKKAITPSSGEPSPFNHFIEPMPDQLLRVSVALAFRRARLKYVYSILRGKDLETGAFSNERRDEQFERLQEAQSRVLGVQHWHDFMKVLIMAGYRSKRMVGSQTNLLFSYTLYLMGRTEFKVPEQRLRQVLAKWYFMSSLTGRYTGSPESRMEFDLARFRGVTDAEGFIEVLETVASEALTNDFWHIGLPNDLATSSPRSPAFFAYLAALNLLDARVLFSQNKVAELLDPATHSNRQAIEKHHLFPKAFLKKKGIVSTRDTNQIGNFALVEWGDNADISDESPLQYLPRYKAKLGDDASCREVYHWHALPDDWEQLDYKLFLNHRRELMAKVIHEGYEKLGKPSARSKKPTVSIADIVAAGETTDIEFKSTLRINLHTQEKDNRMEVSCLKSIAAFLNRQGGRLVIGVADDGSPVGIEADKFPNEDKMYLHLVNLIKERMGPQYMLYIHPAFEDYEDVRVLAVKCTESRAPVFVKDGKDERFYVRTGASTTELTGNQMQEYIRQRFSA